MNVAELASKEGDERVACGWDSACTGRMGYTRVWWSDERYRESMGCCSPSWIPPPGRLIYRANLRAINNRIESEIYVCDVDESMQGKLATDVMLMIEKVCT